MAEYDHHGHRVQTAIAALMAHDPTFNLTQTKHLRVGIDMSKSDACGLATLLMEKGIFTMKEYLDAITKAAADEADSYERMVQSIISNRKIRTL